MEEEVVVEEQGNKASILKNGLIKFILTKGLKVKIILAVLAVIGVLLLLMIIGVAAYAAISYFEEKASVNNDLRFASVGNDSGFWWPVGSNEVVDGIAGGPPALTTISSKFVANRCLGGTCRPHRGFDIGSGGKIGVYNLIATKSGTVVKVFNNCADNGSVDNSCGGQLGNYVTIDHGNGFYSRYQHMAQNSITVKEGDTVRQGQVIGKIGKSGRCTGAHLHFQIHVGGIANSYAVDPEIYVSASNPRPGASSGGVSTGSSDQQTICLTLKKSGYSDDAVAAIMGNIENESGFRPTAVNYIDCRGIVQWCYGRKNNLVATYGSNWNKVENQLEFFLSEMNGSYRKVKTYLSDNHSVEDKAYHFCMKFEIPGASVCASGKRQSSARKHYTYVKNGCR